MKKADVNDITETRTSKYVIQENMPVILTWVASGYTLKSIYKTLHRQEVLLCSYGNFIKYYYCSKKEIGLLQPAMLAEKSTPHASQPAASIKTALPKAAMEAVSKPPTIVQAAAPPEFAYPDELKSYEPESNELESNEPENNELAKAASKRGPTSGFDLERNVTLAKIHFKNNRNRNRRQ